MLGLGIDYNLPSSKNKLQDYCYGPDKLQTFIITKYVPLGINTYLFNNANPICSVQNLYIFFYTRTVTPRHINC